MQQLVARHPAMFIAAFIIFCVLTSMLTMAGLAVVGGWSLLAERYRTERNLPAHRRSMQRAQLRFMTSYNNIVILGSDAEGLYMAMPRFFRVGHPPLFIPWGDIQVEEPQRYMLVMMQRVKLGPDAIPLRVREPLARFLLEPRGAVNTAATGAVSSSF